MAIRGIGRRPDRPADIGADLDRLAGARPETPPPAGLADATGLGAAAPDPNRIGVVVIHGIGTQKPGETLLLWAHSLLRVVNAWAATTPGVAHDNDHALTADIDLTGATRPWVAIDVPAAPGHEPQTWLMTEAWWAARVTPPTLSEMYRWLVPSGELGSLVRGIFHGVSGQDRLLRAIDRVFLVPFVWVATILSVLLYIVLSVVRVVPYKPLQDSALFAALDTFLIDWFGDLRVLLTDRAQAASIRSRAIDAIRACADEGCGTVVVIGHSGGTIVGYTTLADDALEASLPVTRFVTLGQALGIGWRLGHALATTVADRYPDRLYEGDRLDRRVEQVRPGVEWHDFWATHDPAPAGGFANAPALSRPSRTGGTSTMVFNRMSILEDHGGYWDNDEEFLLPVARLLDTSPGKALASASRFFPDPAPRAGAAPTAGPAEAAPAVDPAEAMSAPAADPTSTGDVPDEAPGSLPGPAASGAPASADARSGRSPARSAARQARVAALQRSWALVMLAGALAIPAVVAHSVLVGGPPSFELAGQGVWGFAGWLGERVGLLLDALSIGRPAGALSPTVASLIGIGVFAGAFYAAGWIASRLWQDWDARERELALQPVPQWRPIRQIERPLWLCGAAAMLLLLFAVSGNWLLAAPSAVLVGVAWLLAARVPRGHVVNPPAGLEPGPGSE